MYNRPRLDMIRSKTIAYADTRYCLRIAYSKSARPGEAMTSQKTGATIAIDANGGDSSELLITLTQTAVDQNGDAAASVVNTIDGTTYSTLGAVVDAINAIEGFTAWVLNAPHALDTGCATWSDLAATAIPESPGYLDCLVRSSHADDAMYLRIGEPTERDANWMKVVRVEVAITDNTGGSVELGQDRKGSSYQKYRNYPLTATANTAYMNYDADKAPTFQGPLLIDANATSNTGLVLNIETMQANA